MGYRDTLTMWQSKAPRAPDEAARGSACIDGPWRKQMNYVL